MDTDKTQILNCPICVFHSKMIWSETIYRAFKCKKCRVIFCKGESKQFLYDNRYFYQWYIKPFQKRKRYIKKLLKRIENYIQLPQGKYLDVGCGAGIFLDIAKEKLWQATGIDISSFAIDYCRRKKLNVIQGQLPQLSLQSQYFDGVVLFDVIAHLENPLDYMREIKRIIKDNGFLIIKTPRHPPLLFYIANFLKFTKKSRVLLHIPAQIFHFNEYSLKNVCSQNGFYVVYVFRTSDLPGFFLNRAPVYMMLFFWYSFLKIFCGGDSIVAVCKKI